jgi:hypothetical protein
MPAQQAVMNDGAQSTSKVCWPPSDDIQALAVKTMPLSWMRGLVVCVFCSLVRDKQHAPLPDLPLESGNRELTLDAGPSAMG